MQHHPHHSPSAPRAPGLEVLRRRADDGSAVALVRYPPGMESPAHGHDELSLSMVLGGSVLEEVGAARVVGGPLQAVVKPARTLHENRFGLAGAVMIQILPHRDTLERMADGGPAFGCWAWTDTARPAPWVALARSVAADAGAAELGEWVAEAIACALPDPTRRRGEPPAWLRSVRERLVETAGAAVPLSALAAEHGVHRVHLARAFHAHFGTSPSEFRRRLRLREAVRLLDDDPEDPAAGGPLAGAAHGAGFADQAHMTREFRRWLGLTPGRYRELIRHRA